MAIWLTELANWLRDAGLNVIEYPGWQTRARSSGGYSSMPLCVMWHHTASPSSWDGQKDADYIAKGDSAAPLSNLYIDRSGTVWVLAAGATNTNGKGRSLKFSRGTVPADGMNTRALGVELGNNGVGEAWPQCQTDAMFTVSNTCNAKFGNQPTDISTHQNYAPDRKIDPATAASVQGPFTPRSVNSSGTWDNGDVQTECERRWYKPKPETGDNDVNVPATVWTWGNRVDTFVRGDDGQLYHQWWTEDTQWTAWEPLGGQLAGSPWAQFSERFDRIDVFARGLDNAIWQISWKDNAWTGWFVTSEWPGR